MSVFADFSTYFKTLIFEWKEQRAVSKNFYENPLFRMCDRALRKAYLLRNPYQICKRHLRKKGAENIYTYGETPLTTVDHLARECGISKKDVVVELGAGRGRASLFLATYVGCRVIAYEEVPTFTRILRLIAPPTSLVVRSEDFFKESVFLGASWIYFYGTMMEGEDICRLIDKFPSDAKILTVSFPLCDYSSKYVTSKTLQGRFPWGETEVYINERFSQ